MEQVPRHVAQVAGEGDIGEVHLKLEPRRLGEVRVHIQGGAEGIHVRIVTQSVAAEALLADGQRQLREELQRQGLELASFSASTDGHAGLAAGGDGRSRQQGQPSGSFASASLPQSASTSVREAPTLPAPTGRLDARA